MRNLYQLFDFLPTAEKYSAVNKREAKNLPRKTSIKVANKSNFVFLKSSSKQYISSV